jgi:hypothetical protein
MLHTPFISQYLRSIIYRSKYNPGIKILPSLISQNEIKDLTDCLFNPSSASFIKPNRVITQSGDSDTRYIYKLSRKELLDSIPIDRIFSQLGPSFGTPRLVVAGILKGCKGNIGSGEGWHRDSWFSQTKVLIYLTDQLCSEGAFQYIINSHNFISKIKDFLAQKNDRLNNDNYHINPNLYTALGNKGDGVAFDATGIHRGAPLFAGERLALTFYFFPKYMNLDKIYSIFKIN